METTALLQHDDSPTAIMASKVRTLMQFNALKQGYMPADDQIQQHISALVASPVLKSSQRGLGRQSKLVLDDICRLFKALGLLIAEKNEGNTVQEIVWNLRRAKADTDMDGDMFASQLDYATARADAKTAHLKAKAIADVLYSNPQFRALLHDGSILARDVLSDVVEATATAIAPEESDLIELEQEPTDVDGRTIENDVEETKEQIQAKVDNAKAKLRQKYDEATAIAIETLHDLQIRGQKFSDEVQTQAASALENTKEQVSDLSKKGKEMAANASDVAQKSVDQALSKIQEVTGIDTQEIRRQLDEGISVEDLLQQAKHFADESATKIKKGMKDADLKAGDMLTQAKSMASDVNKKGGKMLSDAKQSAADADQKAGAAMTDAKEAASKAANNSDTTSIGQQAKNKAQETSGTAQSRAKEVAGKAKDGAKEITNKGQDTAKDVSEQVKTKADDVSKRGSEVRKDLNSKADNATDGKQTGNRLETLGIVHPQSGSGDATGSATLAGSGQSEEEKDLLKDVITQLKRKVGEFKEMSSEDLEQAARQYIEEASSKAKDALSGTEDAQDKIASAAGDAKARGKEVASSAQKTVTGAGQEAGEKGTKVAAKAKDAADEAATTAQTVGSKAVDQAKETSSNLAEQADQATQKAGAKANDVSKEMRKLATQVKAKIDDTSVDDLRQVITEYVEATKKKVEETTGITEQDARKAIGDASDQVRSAGQATLEQGRAGLQQAQEKSGQALAQAKETSAKVGHAVQEGAVEVAAQGKHTFQNAKKGAAGQIHETLDASQDLIDGTINAVSDATADIRGYLNEKFPAERRKAIQNHFRLLVVSLRDNSDYSNGLDGLISVGKKYVDYTMTFVDAAPTDPSQMMSTNQELDQAVRLTLQLIERFSNGVGFDGVQRAYKKLKQDISKEKDSGDFLDDCMLFFKKMVQDLKYAASEEAEKHGNQLLSRIDEFSEDTGFKQDVSNLIREVVHLAEGFASDRMTLTVYQRGQTLFQHLLLNDRGNFVFKRRLVKDFFNVLMPSALKLVQYIPISRVEFQNADIDLLIENLVFESSASHDQSFLPYKLKVENNNVVEFLNAYKFESDYSQQLTVKIEGLTLAVRDAGFYIRKKTGFWRFTDSGLLDLMMDGKGIDVDIDIQMSTEDEEADVTKDALFIVKDVRVKVHKMDFSTSGAKHGWLIGLVKPFIKGFVKRQVGLAVAAAVTEQLEYYEYQLRMFQHRIKTAYIANNGQASFASFFRAIFTANAGNAAGRKGQFEVVVGGTGPLRGIHTKASLTHELEYRDDIVAEEGHGHSSWRNDIFDFHA